MQWLAKIRDDIAGSALLEGAVVTPFLCVLCFGVFEFSYYFYQQHVMATGVADAARYIARACDPTATATVTSAQNLASTGSTAGGTGRRVTGWDPAEVNVAFTNVDNSAGTYRGPNTIRIVNVIGNFTYVPLGFWGYFGFSIPVVQIAHSERVIGGTVCP